jgi:endonuclease YncB( thermonuclease family)
MMSRSLVFALVLTGWPLAVAQAQCRLPDGGPARVAGIPDGRSLLLEDGREILLAGIEPAPAWPGAQAGLAQRVAGQAVTLRGLSPKPDRYGRLAAFVFVNASETPVQYDLLGAGLVRVAGPVEAAGCRSELLRQERRARDARTGLWSDSAFGLRAADRPADIGITRGHFAVVEGKVVSVREAGATIYVNFGQRWSEDFTATIAKRLEPRFTSAGLTPRSLSGRLVRIRGMIENRGGPWIDVIHPDQIEVAEFRQ